MRGEEMGREQRLEAALRNAHAFIWNVVPVPGSLLSDKKRATLQAIAAVLGEQEATPECTGLAATWCPIHGDCTCRPHGDGMADHKDDPTCPLHAPSSPHGESVGEQEATPPEPITLRYDVEIRTGDGALLAGWLELPTGARTVEEARKVRRSIFRLDWSDARVEELRERPLAASAPPEHADDCLYLFGARRGYAEPCTCRPALAPQGEPEPPEGAA